MIHEIQAKTLLATVRGKDPVFGLKYNMNLYRGCEHQCIYCDSRSECYQIENFHDILVKVNAIELLKKELPRKRIKGTIGTGSMSDPYIPLERRYNLTGQALQIIASYGFPVHINTKSDLVIKDLETLKQINLVHASVCFTITTTDDTLARKIEPGAPTPTRRFKAMAILASQGIHVGVSMMPILPFIEDNPENITRIVEQTSSHGGQFIIPWLGMSLRDRQRLYYYEQLERLFPGLKQKYEKSFGERYECPANHQQALWQHFEMVCRQNGIATKITPYQSKAEGTQPPLF